MLVKLNSDFMDAEVSDILNHGRDFTGCENSVMISV